MTSPQPYRWALPLLLATVAVIVFVLLRPFDLVSPNGVTWLAPGPGIYFDGSGIAYTAEPLPQLALRAAREVTVELWLRERPKSMNWGVREILSFYDGKASPPLLVAAEGSRLHLFSRFGARGAARDDYFLVPDQRLPRGETHQVSVVLAREERAVLLDGQLLERRALAEGEPLAVTGRLVVGARPSGTRGWWGELHGLAVFAKALSPAEIRDHAERAETHGLASLRQEAALLALYPFDEGGGEIARSLVAAAPPIRIPARFAPLLRAVLRYPGDDVRAGVVWKDAGQNVVLFVPFGLLLGLLLARRDGAPRPRHLLWIAGLSAVLSLGGELSQIFLRFRDGSTVDVLWNTTGGFTGAWLARAWLARASPRDG